MEESLNPYTGVTCKFSDRQITSEKGVILVHTIRTAGVKEVAFQAKVELLLVMKKSMNPKTAKNYVITEQVLLNEEYIPVNTAPDGVS